MPWKDSPDLWGFIGALFISLLSGAVAVANRIAGGHPFSLVWFCAQLGGSLLAGYLMWDVYPAVAASESWPAWATMPICVSVAAHFGGKCFSLAEKVFINKFNLPTEPG